MKYKQEDINHDINKILPSNWGQRKGAKKVYWSKLKKGTFKQNLEKMNKASSNYKKKWHKYMKEKQLNFEKNGFKFLLVVSKRVAESYNEKGFNLIIGSNSLSNFLQLQRQKILKGEIDINSFYGGAVAQFGWCTLTLVKHSRLICLVS